MTDNIVLKPLGSNVTFHELSSIPIIVDNDEILVYDVSEGAYRKIAFEDFVDKVDHDKLTNWVANKHIDWTNTIETINAGHFYPTTANTYDVGHYPGKEIRKFNGYDMLLRNSLEVWNASTLSGITIDGITISSATPYINFGDDLRANADNRYFVAGAGADSGWGYDGTNTIFRNFSGTGSWQFGDATNYTEIKNDGEINLVGTARVKKVSWVDAGGIRAPGSKPATFVESGIAGSWEFADAVSGSEEAISGIWKIPKDMEKSEGITMKLNWYANGINPGNCKWQLEYLWVALNEDETAAAQETLSVVSTASATSNGMVNAEFTGIDIPGASDSGLFFRITRMSAHADDTISAVTLLRGRAIIYTANKLGGAT